MHFASRRIRDTVRITRDMSRVGSLSTQQFSCTGRNEMGNTLKTALEVIREYQRQMGATIVAERTRMGTLAKMWGRADCLNVESSVYAVARRVMPAYTGGYWDFVMLPSGGFYMALDAAKQYRVEVEGNGFEGELSGDGAGIVVCLMTYSLMSFGASPRLQPVLVSHYEKLRDYLGEHPEALNIFAAID